MPAGVRILSQRKGKSCTAGLGLGCLMGVESLLPFSSTDPHLGLHSVLSGCHAVRVAEDYHALH